MQETPACLNISNNLESIIFQKNILISLLNFYSKSLIFLTKLFIFNFKFDLNYNISIDESI